MPKTAKTAPQIISSPPIQGQTPDPQADQPIEMLDSGGQTQLVAPENYDNAVAAGLYQESPEEKQTRLKNQQYGGFLGGAEALGEGAARTASFGLSDVFLRSAGVPEDRIRNVKEVNPGWSAGGEYGMLATALLPGGWLGALGKAGKVIEGVGILPRMASKGGQLAGKLVADGLGGGKLAKIIGEGTWGALEGSLYGAAQGTSEVMMGENADDAAEHILSSTGLGAATGGVFSAGLTTALAGLTKGASKMSDLVSGWADSTGKELKKGEKSLLEGSAQGLAGVKDLGESAAEVALEREGPATTAIPTPEEPGLVYKVLGRATGTTPEKAKIAYSKAGREAMEVTEDDLVKGATEQAQGMDSIQNKSRDILSESREGKSSQMSKLVKEDADHSFDVGKGALTTQYVGELKSLNHMIDEGIGTYDDQAILKELRDMTTSDLRDVSKLSEARAKDPTSVSLSDLFTNGDNHKRDWGKIGAPALKYNTNSGEFIKGINAGASGSGAQIATANELNKAYHVGRDILEKEDLWGAGAVAQQNLNKSWTSYLEDIKRPTKHRLDLKWGSTDWTKKVENDADAHLANIKDAGTLRSDTPYNKSQLKKLEELVDEHEKYYALTDTQKTTVKDIREEIAKWTKNQDHLETTIKLQNNVKDFSGKMSGALGSAPMIGALVGGIPGAILGYVGSTLANPQKLLQKWNGLIRLSKLGKDTFSDNIDKMAAGMIPKSGATLGDLARAGETLGRKALIKQVGDESRERTYNEQKNAVMNFARNMNNPAFAEELKKMVHPVGDMEPKIAKALVDKTKLAASFLMTKMPQLTEGQTKVAPYEMAKFDRYCRAVDNPNVLLTDAMAGKLNMEAAEVVKNVYPAKYREMLQTVVTQLGDKIDRVPPKNKEILSIALDAPIMTAMRPEYLQMIQTPMPSVENELKPSLMMKAMSKNMERNPAQDMTGAQRTQYQTGRM